MEFFATCPAGFERLLADELGRMGTQQVRPLKGQVAFGGKLADAYRVCLWSHLASRVVLVLGRFSAKTSEELYAGMYDITWEEHLLPTSTLAVDASGTNSELRSTQFSAVRAKDAIVDRLSNVRGARISVDTKQPDVRVSLRVSRDRATAGIDLAGTPLFKRGYERSRSHGGLRPDYAAALLILAQWQTSDEGTSLLALASYPDTLLVEAALMAANRAPGLSRSRWGFSRWALHDEAAWTKLVEDAHAKALSACGRTLFSQSLAKTTVGAKSLLRSLGIEATIHPLGTLGANDRPECCLLVADLSDIRPHEVAKEATWLGVLAHCTHELAPMRTIVASRDEMPAAYLAQAPDDVVRGMLGQDTLELQAFGPLVHDSVRTSVELAQNVSVPVLVPASDQFAARLKKVAKARAKWARREDVSCYRLYDSDLPDYAVTLDLFQGTDPRTGELDGRRWLQIFEYAAPKDVDASLARMRLMDVLAIAPRVLKVHEDDTFLHVRRRDKGGSQYAQEAKHAQAYALPRKGGEVPLPEGAHLIDEGGLTFEVNFTSRLDCGIFLDHRDTRGMLREMAKETKGSKRFLNLFAYTGTATCYAADGGMRYTTTVDLSRPSLDWARRNMARNGFVGREHEFVQADVVAWIREQRRTKNRWDLVFCDVPTFSNSSRMGRRSFDVQRDHAELLIGVSRLLTRNGTCVFSCNLRTFKPDVAALAKAGVTIEDITTQTIPEDFARNQRIHRAYLVRRG